MATSREFRHALAAVVLRERGLRLSTPRPVTTREWLGMVLLDHAGWVPSDLCGGVSLVVTHDADLVWCVDEGARRLYRRVLAGMAGLPHDGGLTVVTVRNDGSDYDEAVNRGAPVLGVAEEVSHLEPVGAWALPERMHTVALPLSAAVVADLVECVTGTRYRVTAADLAGLRPVDVIRAVHGDHGGVCVDRLRERSREVAAADGAVPGVPGLKRKAVPGAPTPAPAAPTAPAVPRVGGVRRLSDMTGFGEAATWGINLARDVRDYRDGKLPWSDVDKGLLLSGPPGGGKTTFAAALALECDLELVPTTYGMWATGNAGDTVQKGLNRLFEQWREKARKSPFILFWDEVDSIGRRNNTSQGDYWFWPVINSWLAFLDGAIPRDGIIVVGATNHPDNVDAALRRPGRLDRHLELPMPDVAPLTGIVRLHLGEDAVLPRDDLAEAARAVRGRSPAEVGLLCREARRIARWCGRRVCASDLTEVVAMSREPCSTEAARLVALHEGAHAVAGLLLGVDELTCVDLDAGRTSFVQRPFPDRSRLEDRLVMMLAGRAAEEVMLGSPTTSAQQDLHDATLLATAMHAGWGYGAAGLVHVAADVAARDGRIQAAVRATLDEAYARALALVTAHRETVERMAQALAARRYLDADEARELVFNKPAPPPSRGGGGPLRRLRAVAGS